MCSSAQSGLTDWKAMNFTFFNRISEWQGNRLATSFVNFASKYFTMDFPDRCEEEKSIIGSRWRSLLHCYPTLWWGLALQPREETFDYEGQTRRNVTGEQQKSTKRGQEWKLRDDTWSGLHLVRSGREEPELPTDPLLWVFREVFQIQSMYILLHTLLLLD
jgi:hypothetical protein